METETLWLEVQLYPDNDEIWFSGKWDKETRVVGFDITPEELSVIGEMYHEMECNHDWLNAVIEYIGEERSYVSEFWGEDGIYVDSIEVDGEPFEPYEMGL
jgi:hypothetical protein